MAIRNILTDKDPTLRKKCREVTNFDERLHILLDDMRETMDAANGVGLAAPQVGILRRVVVVHTGEEYIELVNPVIISQSGEQTDAEGCLSLPGVCGTVTRPNFVKVRAQDRLGMSFEIGGEGLTARAFCHELDHLDGILYTEVMERYLTEDELAYDEED